MSAGETTLFIKKAPSVQVRAKILTWRNANNVSIALGYAEYPGGCEATRDSKKGLRRVLI